MTVRERSSVHGGSWSPLPGLTLPPVPGPNVLLSDFLCANRPSLSERDGRDRVVISVDSKKAYFL